MPDDTLKYTKFDNFLMAEIMQGKYSQTETRVLLAIIRQTAGFHRSSATISSAQLAKMTNIQARHVSSAVRSLIDKGRIKIAKYGKQNTKIIELVADDKPMTESVIEQNLSYDEICHRNIGQNLSEVIGQNLSYVVPSEPLETLAYRDPKENTKENTKEISCASDDAQGGISENKEPVLDKPTKKQKTQTEADEFFETLWEMYPRKKGKGNVKPVQKKKLYAIGMEEMTRAVERYRQYIAGKDKQYIQYGSTFFNSGYVDYLDENYQPETKRSKTSSSGMPANIVRL